MVMESETDFSGGFGSKRTVGLQRAGIRGDETF
jgi:hypothetical protein